VFSEVSLSLAVVPTRLIPSSIDHSALWRTSVTLALGLRWKIL